MVSRGGAVAELIDLTSKNQREIFSARFEARHSGALLIRIIAQLSKGR